MTPQKRFTSIGATPLTPERLKMPRCSGAPGLWLAIGLALLAAGLAPAPAAALVHFDFDQAFYAHPGRQVWDFSVTRVDSVYHIFYHSIPEAKPGAANADTIWTAASPDLKHWSAPVPILFSGTGVWDTNAVWAPDIFRDEPNDRWGLAYTGADTSMNQRMGLAFSPDLVTWTPGVNPALAPDPSIYNWKPDGSWSDFRDPFVWQQDGSWHVLLTAKQLNTGRPLPRHQPGPAAVDRRRSAVPQRRRDRRTRYWKAASTTSSTAGTTCSSASSTRWASATSAPRTRPT